ncbi:MAG: hypothetical protein U0797_21535 [Gemmataceae bacterium]
MHLGRVTAGRPQGRRGGDAEVGGDRPHTMRNHTATHLLNWAREVLGDHVEQKGSPCRCRQDAVRLHHDKPLSHDDIGKIERLVNERIYADLPVTATAMPLADAKKVAGVRRAVFGEKYRPGARAAHRPRLPEKASRGDSVELAAART